MKRSQRKKASSAVTPDHFDRTFNINARGVYSTVQKALPLLNDGASIILSGSVVGQKGMPIYSTYAATKAALRSYVRTWAAEFGRRGIRANVISPGPIETPILDRQFPTKEAADALREQFKAQMLEGSDLLVAVERVPNTRSLGLEKTGVEIDDRGYVRVNERLQTSAPGIWAMGECAGSPHFTHVATDDFRAVRDNLKGEKRTTQGRLVPFCMFSDPELARVGLNESEAQKQAIRYRLATISMGRVRRTVTLSETRGVMKALIGVESDEILGFTAFGTDAGEMMPVVQTIMLARLPYTAVRDAIFAHPTMAEGLTVLFGAAPAQSRAYATQSRQ